MSALSYNQVALVPRYSTLRSRSEADVSVEFLGRRFRLPVVPANMETVIDVGIARWLSENDYFYIYHRFSDTDIFVRQANYEKWKMVSISVGVKEEDKALLKQMVKEGLRIDFITIDVAHGHHIAVKEMIEFVKGLYLLLAPNTMHPLPKCPKIIAGNVATPEAVRDLAEWGADCAKVGIGASKVCTTRHQTGFGLPMFSCVKDCNETLVEEAKSETISYKRWQYSTIPIIADGGIRENGDITKALVAGATMVMAGGLFAACTDAPGENVYSECDKLSALQATSAKNAEDITEDRWLKRMRLPVKKKFYGSASSRQKKENKHVEGVELEIPCNGMTVEQLYQDIRESLQSSVSYSGGKDLSAFKNVKWVEVK